MAGHSQRKEQLQGIPSWDKIAELEGPGSSSLRPRKDDKARDPSESSDSKPQLPTILSWDKTAQLEGPGSSSLRPPNDNKTRNPFTDSEASSVVNDLGDAKQLAETRRRRSSPIVSTTSTGQLVAEAGSNFPKTPSRVTNIDSDLSPKEAVGGKAKDVAVKLGRKIRAALQTSSWEKEHRKFLPIDELERIINIPVIEGEFLRHGKDAGLAQKVWGTKGSKSELTTRRKIFAILVMVDNVPAITDFIDKGIFDSHLPFLFRDGTGERAGTFDVYRKLKGREGEPDREIEIAFFQEWDDLKLESFKSSQWQVLAPYFSLVSNDGRVSHYNLDDRSVLPFIEDYKVDEPLAQHGGSADVRRVKIHKSHQNIRIANDAEHPSYAIKRLHSTDYNDFQREVDTLKRFSGNNQHEHLINLLLTYYYRGQYHLLFHWADGNLLHYWNTLYPHPNEPSRDCCFARWVCRQWLGVVEGLQAIHKYTPDPKLPSRETRDPFNPRVHGRHGDLKPENILWFKKSPFPGRDMDDQLGSFVISDFGLTMFHHNKTVNASNLAGTRTYRPPEYDVREKVSQKCDIWSLGCVMLEFLIWYRRGWKGVEDFQTDRIKEDNCEIPEDVFFNATNKDPADRSVQLKRSVAKIFESLRDEQGTTEFYLDVLELVEKKLLRMRPKERAECKEIVDKFRDFHNKCQAEWYCTIPICRPQRTPTTLSELMATPIATTFHETNKMPEMSPVIEQESTIQQKINSISGKINGHRSPKSVYTAPEPQQSYGYHKGEAYQLAPERGTLFDFEREPMMVDEGADVSMTPAEVGSPEQAHLDRKEEAIKPPPPLKTLQTKDSGYGTAEETADSSLESTPEKKRDRSEMDDGEYMDADPRKRVRT